MIVFFRAAGGTGIPTARIKLGIIKLVVLGSLYVEDGYQEQYDVAGYYGSGAICAGTGTAGSSTEVVGDSGAEYEAGYGDGGVRVAFAGEDELTEGAAAEKYGTPAYDAHAQEVHEAIGVSNCLNERFVVKLKKEKQKSCQF